MIRNIRSYIGNHDLQRKARFLNRRKAIHNFSTAKTAGVLFRCKNEEDFNAVKDFKQYLESHRIRTEVLGYVHEKQVPDHYLLRTGFNFFCLKDLNWFKRPVRKFALDFSTRKYDILFDLSLEDDFPLKYLSELSPATYKIGVFTEARNYDLMIELQYSRTVSYFVEQVKHYLTLIHSKNS